MNTARWHFLVWLTTISASLLALGNSSSAQPAGGGPEDAALRNRATAFVAAFNQGDAKAVAGFWTQDGDFVNDAGHEIKGRQALEDAYRTLFAEAKGAKLKISPGTRRFARPDVLVEDGTTEVTAADGQATSTATYTAVLIKENGQWLLASVREGQATPPSNYGNLRVLEWLIGDWADESNKDQVASATFTWAENRNFIVAATGLSMKDVPAAGQTQWIAWDAFGKRIRSWSFHSNGGLGEAIWENENNHWVLKSTTMTPDGKKMTATHLLTPVDTDHFTWQSTQRSLEGQSLPDTPVLTMQRMK